jgi:hypothetical protein
MTSIHSKPRACARYIIIDDENVLVNGERNKRAVFLMFEARKGFVLPEIAVKPEGDSTSGDKFQVRRLSDATV